MGRRFAALAHIETDLREWAERMRAAEEKAAKLPDDEKRKLFREHCERQQAAADAGRYYREGRPSYLIGLTCGARTRSGKPCGMTALHANGRCVWHGGMSTGPRTPEGRARALENLKLGRLKRGKS